MKGLERKARRHSDIFIMPGLIQFQVAADTVSKAVVRGEKIMCKDATVEKMLLEP